MSPTLDRIARAYAPLAARNRLVEGGLHPLPRRRSVPRMSLFALLGGLFRRGP